MGPTQTIIHRRADHHHAAVPRAETHRRGETGGGVHRGEQDGVDGVLQTGGQRGDRRCVLLRVGEGSGVRPAGETRVAKARLRPRPRRRHGRIVRRRAVRQMAPTVHGGAQGWVQGVAGGGGR